MVLMRKDGSWQPVVLTNYGSEADLRDQIARSPALVPGCAGSATATEVWIPGVGSVDVVCVTTRAPSR